MPGLSTGWGGEAAAMYRILRKRVLTPVTKEFIVEAPLVARSVKPGQFVILRHGPVGERIPLTIADFDSAAGTLTLAFQEVGKTTQDLGGGGVKPDLYDPDAQQGICRARDPLWVSN